MEGTAKMQCPSCINQVCTYMADKAIEHNVLLYYVTRLTFAYKFVASSFYLLVCLFVCLLACLLSCLFVCLHGLIHYVPVNTFFSHVFPVNTFFSHVLKFSWIEAILARPDDTSSRSLAFCALNYG